MAIYTAHGFLFDKGEKRTHLTPRGEFKVRDFKLEIKETGSNGQEYSTIPEFSAMNEMADMFDYDSVIIGLPLEVSFVVQGREMKWNDKVTGEPRSAWKTNLKAIKISQWKQDQAAPAVQPPQPAPVTTPQPQPQPQPTFNAPPQPQTAHQPQAAPQPQSQGAWPTEKPEPPLGQGDVDFTKPAPPESDLPF